METEPPITKKEMNRGAVSGKTVIAIRRDYRMWCHPKFEGAPKNKYQALVDKYKLSLGTIHNIVRGKGAYKNV